MATPTNMAAPPEQPQEAIQPSPAAAPVPHGQLLSMIQGLANGVGAFGKAIATQGREGGVADVQAYQENQQKMELEKQKATQELSESQARVAFNRASTNHMILQDQINLQKAPDEIQMAHTQNQKAMIDLYKEAGLSPMAAVLMIQGQDPQVHMGAVSSASNGDLVNNTAIPIHDGKAGQGGTTNIFSSDSMSHLTFTKDKLAPVLGQEANMLAVTEARLGADDPSVKQAKVMLEQAQQAPQMNGEDFFRHNVAFTNMLSNAVARKEAMLQATKEVADVAKAKQEADPLFKMENDPKSMEGPAAAAAVPLLQNKIATETDPVQKLRETRLLAQAQASHANYLRDISSKASAEAVAGQNARQGDPVSAGTLLANGDLTLADLKSRGTTTKFIVDATNAAKKIKPDYNPADEVIAEKVASSPAQNQFFGSANSLISKGGTADQLMQLSKSIPQNDIPVLNTLEDWEKLKTGKGPLAGYASVALGVADDYGKVMGGGNASDTARNSALAIIGAAQSPEQRQAAIDGIRGAVKSQRDSRIGNNQFLQRAYGQDELGGQASQSSAQLSNFHVNPQTGERIGWNGKAWVPAPK